MPNEKYKKIEEIGKSDCCGSDVYLGGSGDFSDDDEICTRCFLCSACNKPCNIELEGTTFYKGNNEDNTPKFTSKKIEDKKEINKVIGIVMYEENVERWKKDICNGNIQAKLDMILHNQLILNDKLNKILERR